MCGIAGWVAFGTDLTTQRPTIEAMTATMALRGPDDTGTWICGDAGLGHCRLSIVDLAGGVQPMMVSTPGGPVVIVYTGETYNFRELRRTLTERGHVFRTSSDTEVVLRGYLEWGASIADRLNGMTAMAIWDGRESRLLLIRDRMGVKPLYFYPTADGVLFGSEPKAILANPLVPKVIDADGVRELMAPVKRPGWALWKGMYEVEPGTIVTVTEDGLRTHTYWQLETAEHVDDYPTTVAWTRDLLADIIRRQLVADVPQGLLLSGGLDSSALTGLASLVRDDGDRPRTFAVDFAGQAEHFKPDALRVDLDAPYIADVARFAGSEHRDIVLSPALLNDPELRRKTITARDMPSCFGDLDGSLYLLFQAIRGETTVALSGDAADEVFGGYTWFHNEKLLGKRVFPWMLRNHERPGRNVEGPPLTHPSLNAVLDIGQYLVDQYDLAVAGVEHLDDADTIERQTRTMSYLNMTRLVRLLLDRKDRMSMSVGLEVRVPFCDHRLVEYVYNVPWAMKTSDGRPKSLLRAAVRDVIPPSVHAREKSAYPSIQDPAYVGSLQLQAKEALVDNGNALFELVSPGWVRFAVEQDPAAVSYTTRAILDQVVELYHFFDLYRPQLALS
ncbi:asparagine synthase (glutamine-hydrolyzing) [Actinocrispum sp. NPDC049592]|uniref:asparagine synthase (glutamine-hydrolyzing) n=1 Tax=Actinocrispum sp. NPDC049592 TaxID=3154835 RepID=UPI00342DE766